MGPIAWWTERHVDAAHALAREGLRQPEIARRLSQRFRRTITPGALDHACRRLGRPLRTPRGRPSKRVRRG